MPRLLLRCARRVPTTRSPSPAARHWRQHVPLGHRQRRPYADGPPARLPEGLLRGRPRRCRDQGGAGAGRDLRRPGRLRDHGPGPPGRRRPEPGPPGRRGRWHPDVGALVHPQQGLPLRSRRDRAGRPAHPRRRVRDRRRRWHGVDDPGTAPARQLAHRHQVRRHQAGRRHGPRRAVGHLRPGGHGSAHRAAQRRLRPDPRGAGRLRRRIAPAGRRRREERPVRRRDRPGAHPAAQGRPDRVQGRRGHPRRHDGREPRPSSGPPSPRTARSPPAPPRRSPTAPARSSS